MCREGGGGQSRARRERLRRSEGGANCTLPGALPSPFQCGVPLTRARTSTAHAPRILNLHWRRPPWQPHMRGARREAGGNGVGEGRREGLTRLPPARPVRMLARQASEGLGSLRAGGWASVSSCACAGWPRLAGVCRG